EIWSDIADDPSPGRDTAYVQTGNSLLLLVYRHRIETEFGITLSLAELYQSERISRLSRVVRHARKSATRPGRSSASRAEQFLSQLLARHAAPGLAVATCAGGEVRRYAVGLS